MPSEKELFGQLKSLKKIEPRQDWKQSGRELLLSQIKSQRQKLEPRLSVSSIIFIEFKKLTAFTLRPAGVVIVISTLAMGSGIVTVNAAFSSLPGDTLYPVKITAERVQLSLKLDEKDKMTMEMELAGKRIEELKKVKNSNESSARDAKIKIPLQRFTEELGSINNRLDNLKKTGNAADVVNLAVIVDDMTESYTSALEATKKEMPSSTKDTIKEALAASEKTNNNAVSIIIDNHNQANNKDAKDDLVKKVEDRINKTDERVKQLQIQEKINTTDIKEASIKSDEIKKTLDEARVLLESGNLSSAFDKVKESNELARTAEDINDDKAEATAASASSDVAAGAANTNSTNTNSEQPSQVEGGAMVNENVNVSGSLLYEESK
jgi:hypothetical protein